MYDAETCAAVDLLCSESVDLEFYTFLGWPWVNGMAWQLIAAEWAADLQDLPPSVEDICERWQQ